MSIWFAEGKIDLEKLITDYVPELQGTVWDAISTCAVANMTTGLENEETLEAILQPDHPEAKIVAR